MRYKRTLARTLFDRTRRICTQDSILREEEKEESLTNALVKSRYPYKFIRRYSKPKIKGPTVQMTPKKKDYIQLPFKCGMIMYQVARHLRSSINRVFNPTELRLLSRTTTIPVTTVKEPMPALSDVIYK